MLRYDRVSFVYPGTTKPVSALEGYDLTVEAGEPVSLIGPSGCGKSTSLFLAAGLLQPTIGQVLVAGEKVEKPRLSTALILQDFGLLPWKTVFENAALGLRIRDFPKDERLRRTENALAQVGLSEFARMYPHELSGGMRQRLALARTLALDVDLMLMDEPLSSLDALLRESLQDVLLGLWRSRGYAQVLVTHSIEEAVFLGRRIVVMSPRPGCVSFIIENPAMGSTDYRGTEEFYRTCQQVRLLLHQDDERAEDKAALTVTTNDVVVDKTAPTVTTNDVVVDKAAPTVTTNDVVVDKAMPATGDNRVVGTEIGTQVKNSEVAADA